MSEKPKIILFGNSHVSAFSGKDMIIQEYPQTFESEDFTYVCNRLGPCTAYNFFWTPKYYPTVLRTLDANAFRNDTICLLLGEIDCHVHIGLNAEKSSRPLDECIEEVVDRYMLCLLDLKHRGYKVLVIAVQPASTCGPSTNPDGPVYGDFAFRNRLTRKFNALLEQTCKIHRFLFCSIFDKLMIDDVTPSTDIFMDYVHLRGSVVRPMFEQELKKLF